MQRRITLAMLIVVVGSLLLAGLGSVALTSRQSRIDAQGQLLQESQALEPFVVQARRDLVVDKATATATESARLVAARKALRLADATAVTVNANGELLTGTLPGGVTSVDLAGVVDGTGATSGNHGRLVWAVALSAPNVRGRRLAVVLTRHVPIASGTLRWLALSGGVALLAAAAASMFVGRALIGPLRQVDAATRRIADGDLATRVAEPAPGAVDELADLARSINAMAQSLERSRGLEHQFLMSVSHDLRTPLTAIRGYAEAISDGATDDVAGAAIVIVTASKRLERLVGDLLDLAKLDARQFSFHPRRELVAPLVTTTAEGFRPRIGEAGLALTVETEMASSIEVAVDPDRFGQALANLVENALKYASSEVRVVASPDVQAGVVEVSVIDDGPGIAPADLPFVFDRLYVSAAVPSRLEAGSGLGLAIARDLIGAMGGSVAAERGDGNVGTKMMVRLPIVNTRSDSPSPLSSF